MQRISEAHGSSDVVGAESEKMIFVLFSRKMEAKERVGENDFLQTKRRLSPRMKYRVGESDFEIEIRKGRRGPTHHERRTQSS